MQIPTASKFILITFASLLTISVNAQTPQDETSPVSQTEVADVVDVGNERLSGNRAAQNEVDQQVEKSQALLKQYMEENKLLDSLNLYNGMLKRQLDSQEQNIATLNHSINNATLIERQILPLLDRMVDSLENFVKLDVPFLAVERAKRVTDLKALLDNPALTTSEKARRVFEAYQIENEFGYTIEFYQDNVTVEQQKFAVEMLRVGRIALLYIDNAGERFGFWDQTARKWKALTQSQYKRHITKGLRIAKEEMAPELITIPLVVNKEQR